MRSFLDKVRNFIQNNELLEHGEQVTVGVSGGADSVCLLFVLLDLQEEYDLKIRAVYVEHGIRGEESVEDGRFVEQLCIARGVPFRQVDVDAPELARAAGIPVKRYELFEGGGKYRRLTMDEAAAVARVLNVPVGLVCKPDGSPHVFA